MEDLIRQAFLHVEVIGPHVAEGHYDLIGPNGEIILPQVWATMIEPDWAITMHMWPIPERRPPGHPGGPMPGPHPGHQFDPNRNKNGQHRPRPPPGPPQSSYRGPPIPPGWVGEQGIPPRPGPSRERDGPGGPPVIVMTSNPGPSKSRPKKTELKNPTLIGWMIGNKGIKASGKSSSRYLLPLPSV
jgi:hypothetical protein